MVTEHSCSDGSGCVTIESTWFNVVAWQNDKMPALSTLERGSRVHVLGRLRIRNYINTDGEPRIMNEVVADSVKVN